MDDYLIYIALGILVIIVIAVSYSLINNKKKANSKSIDIQGIVSLIDRNNVVNVEYIRNKIIIHFKDLNLFNIEEFHSSGIKGINVIGDKIKFYVDDDNEINKEIYEAIKAFIEGKW